MADNSRLDHSITATTMTLSPDTGSRKLPTSGFDELNDRIKQAAIGVDEMNGRIDQVAEIKLVFESSQNTILNGR